MTGAAPNQSNHGLNTLSLTSENSIRTHTIKDAHKRVSFHIVEDKPLPKPTPQPRLRQTALNGSRARFGNCVYYLRALGYYVPQNSRIYARTLPVKSSKLPPEGKVVVAVTYESSAGHVVAVKNVGGKLVAVADSAFPAGRIVPLSVFKGYL